MASRRRWTLRPSGYAQPASTARSRCPRGIDIANVMEALRQLVLRKKYDRVTLDQLSDEQLRELPQVAIISSLRKLTA